MRSATVFLLTVLLAAGCRAQPSGQGAARPGEGPDAHRERATMSEENKARVIAMGRDYVKQNFPDFSEARKTPIVEDAGEDWSFTYELPLDMLGGAPVVLLSKRDLSVTRAYRTQ